MDQSEGIAATQVAELAKRVDCFAEGELATLAGVEPGTLEAWRKRGKGPDYILIGRNYLYPCKAVTDYLQTLVRVRSSGGIAKALL